jgi:xanthine dehydrogenase accessory factor
VNKCEESIGPLATRSSQSSISQKFCRSRELEIWNDILEEADRLRADEHPFVVATVVAFKSPQSARPGSKAIIRSDGSISGWIGGGCVQPIVIQEAQNALKTGKPKLVSISPESNHGDWKGVEVYQMSCQGGGSLEIFLEPVIPKPEFIIVGNSPIAQILSGFGRLLDFKVCVADPAATKERFPEAHVILNDLESVRGRITSRSYVVVATMGTGDEEGLQAVVGTTPDYLGLVASKEKAKQLFQYLLDKDNPAEDLNRIKCPAGIELGSETLPEIALSVMAEIIRLRRSGSEHPPGPIDEPLVTASPLFKETTVATTQSIDPVCGMGVVTANARYITQFEDNIYYFCCIRCKEEFIRSPKLYQQNRRF